SPTQLMTGGGRTFKRRNPALCALASAFPSVVAGSSSERVSGCAPSAVLAASSSFSKETERGHCEQRKVKAAATNGCVVSMSSPVARRKTAIEEPSLVTLSTGTASHIA